MPSRLLAPFVLSCLVLSGCASTPAPTPRDTLVPASPTFASFSYDTGGIEGVVVDESLMPIVGISVGLRGSEAAADALLLQESLTATDGSFAFSHVKPGTYVVVASRVQDEEQGTFVSVEAGAVNRVQLMLRDQPSDLPYYDVFHPKAFVDCVFNLHYPSVISAAISCGISGPGLSATFPTFRINVTKGWNATTSGLVWRPTSGLSTVDLSGTLNAVNSTGSKKLLNRTEGRSPLVMRGFADVMPEAVRLEQFVRPPQSASRPYGLMHQQTLDLHIAVFYHRDAPEFSPIPDA